MAEAKRIKASVVVVPPDTIQLTLTIEEAAHVAVILGNVQCNSETERVFWNLCEALEPQEKIYFRDFYKNTEQQVSLK